MMAEETARQAKEQAEKAKEEAVRLAAAQEERKAKVAALQKGTKQSLLLSTLLEIDRSIG